MNDNIKERMLLQAREALQSGPSTAEQNYNAIIDELERMFGKNHKEVAAELQRIAKTIEDSGNVDDAFAFKQRTCEIMLKRNMEQRRRERPATSIAITAPLPEMRPMAPPPVMTRIVGPMEYVCLPAEDALRTADFYRRTLNAEQLFEHNTGNRTVGIKFAQGPALLLLEGGMLSHTQPVFSTDDIAKVLAELKKNELEPIIGPIPTGLGAIYSFKDINGNSFSVIERKRNR